MSIGSMIRECRQRMKDMKTDFEYSQSGNRLRSQKSNEAPVRDEDVHEGQVRETPVRDEDVHAVQAHVSHG